MIGTNQHGNPILEPESSSVETTKIKADNNFVSIIIPVFNNSDLLENCLTALDRQSYPKEKYEVIVIDNGSTEDIKQVTKKYPQVIPI